MSSPRPELPAPEPSPLMPEPLATDHEGVRTALAGLPGLAEAPLAEHQDRLAAAHEALHEILQPSRTAAGPPRPGSR